MISTQVSCVDQDLSSSTPGVVGAGVGGGLITLFLRESGDPEFLDKYGNAVLGNEDNQELYN